MSNETKKEISKSFLGLGFFALAFCCLLFLLLGILGFGGVFGSLAGFLTRNIYLILLGLILLAAFGWIVFNRRN